MELSYQTLVTWPRLQYDMSLVIKFLLLRDKIMFIKTIFKDLKIVQIIRNYVQKCKLYLYFLIKQNLLISGEKMLMSAELKGCVRRFKYFLGLRWLKYNCQVSSLQNICGIFQKRGTICPSPSICEQPQKRQSWIGLLYFIRFFVTGSTTLAKHNSEHNLIKLYLHLFAT